jgi:hypothetical protein
LLSSVRQLVGEQCLRLRTIERSGQIGQIDLPFAGEGARTEGPGVLANDGAPVYGDIGNANPEH